MAQLVQGEGASCESARKRRGATPRTRSLQQLSEVGTLAARRGQTVRGFALALALKTEERRGQCCQSATFGRALCSAPRCLRAHTSSSNRQLLSPGLAGAGCAATGAPLPRPAPRPGLHAYA